MPCQNGGECSNVITGHVCFCTKDYFGAKCDREYYFMMYIQTIFAQLRNYTNSDYVNGATSNRHIIMSLDCLL